MYTVTVSRDFVAQHFLTVPDPGPEGEVHSHYYDLAAECEGPGLNEYGYLLDIDDLTAALDAIEDRYRDRLLNDLAEFSGLNPSVEHFSRIVADRLAEDLDAPEVETLRVRIREDDVAWAAYERTV
ncbi:6-pyruvoyl trahydropterin synthase family protein [Halalkalicoccus jeotgali]|uniref:6-pyruvoyltetrahydropterin synthase n=1 Tax=Halalkalicoccus jeotgali (strain DSM 18796 / CECT 7217 / JCM 14584 / KCTC 4019 / B3) TaxID=795797 RepID=D8J9B4_HALJB|nr:6-carboxytetrahydropterin synthase [Halalkalicoccus jeotgali]ADJ16383.1 6-pyruvoyltetrahydropterin synthase [Halalkalicoccus jeotgali B3]ELY37117.1 6-pyruvoyltetrahydropterin synthase [Halalkalicoccus jeotgali B3]